MGREGRRGGRKEDGKEEEGKEGGKYKGRRVSVTQFFFCTGDDQEVSLPPLGGKDKADPLSFKLTDPNFPLSGL